MVVDHQRNITSSRGRSAPTHRNLLLVTYSREPRPILAKAHSQGLRRRSRSIRADDYKGMMNVENSNCTDISDRLSISSNTVGVGWVTKLKMLVSAWQCLKKGSCFARDILKARF
ncbi:hypothetical protein RRG08_010456 [Elysia crispata]|uniref:Uncharacterized protein n=1 Tax=Elysia crispata TaxID=231223 RepID=A0AAE1AQQ9_9GAST|nr:hypothetical protein RRG08_010456 [Elysia crispata]